MTEIIIIAIVAIIAVTIFTIIEYKKINPEEYEKAIMIDKQTKKKLLTIIKAITLLLIIVILANTTIGDHIKETYGEDTLYGIIIILAIAITAFIIGYNITTKPKINTEQGMLYVEQPKPNIVPYIRKQLLTQNEFNFYTLLKGITEPLDLQILAKIRLADLVEPIPMKNRSEWYRHFGRVSQKHVDFAICDNMKVLIIIELDDSSHNQRDRQERDYFVNTVLINAGYTVVRTLGSLEPVKQALYDRGYIIPQESLQT